MPSFSFSSRLNSSTHRSRVRALTVGTLTVWSSQSATSPPEK
jgi:hypothetical protein